MALESTIRETDIASSGEHIPEEIQKEARDKGFGSTLENLIQFVEK